MAFGGDVPALRGDAKRAVGRLRRVRVHRLVREEKRKGLRSLALEEVDRELVHDVGDVARVLDVAAVVIERRVHDPAMAVVAHPRVVAGPRHAVVAHVPLADVRGFVAQLPSSRW